MVKFTPTEQKIIDVLSDGERHTREELHACLTDDLSPLSNVRYQITRIRKKINPCGTDIVCQLHCGRLYYRHMRMLANPNDGRK